MSPRGGAPAWSPRGVGIALALVTALVSGVSIYLNGKAVTHFHDETVYTTAKNAIAGLMLLGLFVLPSAARAASPVPAPRGWRRAAALAVVGVIGGSVPFVLFFEGLARAEATQASFIQKTLVVWVALLAVPILRERFGIPHLFAVCCLIAGQAWLVGRVGTLAWGTGETMILAATLLWAVEVVVVKRLLATYPSRLLAAGRMGVGTGLLVVWLAVSGRLDDLAHFDLTQWRWIVASGLLLTAYVATWYAALARAPAVDVTAVLVFGALVTALLSGLADGTPINVVGGLLVAAGTVIIVLLGVRSRPAAEVPVS